MALIEFVGGLVLVLVILADIFRSVLLPRPTHRALRLGPLLGATLAPAWRRIAVRIQLRTARQTFRASLGPLLLVFSISLPIQTSTMMAQRSATKPMPARGSALSRYSYRLSGGPT